MGDETIEYWFGDGAGEVTRWTSPAVHGAILLDFDGDGRIDDAMIDLDGDGRADIAALDRDDDGVREIAFRDDGTGRWAQPTPLEPGGRAPSTCPIPGVTDGIAAAPTSPEPHAARISPLPAEPGQAPRQAAVDADDDGTPDVLLYDSDGDGTADGAVPIDAR